VKKEIVAPNGTGEILATETILQDKHSNVSNISTPKAFVKDKGGFDYVDEAYMRHQLNTHYPIWKWEIVKYEFIGDKAISIHGRLTIIDHGVERYFDAVAAHRIASNQKGYVDLGNDLKGANSDCFKVAVNRLCNIADDVYRKNIPDLELSLDQIKIVTDLSKEVNIWDTIKPKLEDLSINSTNYEATIRKLKDMKG
tara:strand:+ start:142 stop:732 length:591 start_codon:yes stop_codon:yes gene_type:complete